MEKTAAGIQLQRFNTTIDFWISALNDYTLAALCQQPAAGAWSLGQMYLHILDDTDWFVEQIKAALATNDNSDRCMHEDAKAMFRNNSFPDIKIEGPATNTYIPQPHNKDQLLQRLLAIKTTVNQLDFSNTSGKTQHPGLLFFNAVEWLQFAEMHMRHHVKQKKRIDAALFS